MRLDPNRLSDPEKLPERRGLSCSLPRQDLPNLVSFQGYLLPKKPNLLGIIFQIGKPDNSLEQTGDSALRQEKI